MSMYKCLFCKKECESSRQKKNKYCSIQCQIEYQYTTRVNEWLTEGKDWKGMIPNWVRRALAETYGSKCSVCGIDKHNGKEITLEVDHKDGDHTNNFIKNLRLICPNCHSQTPTYKNRNKGNGRTIRRKVI
jgi:5-methylcytosine-specific restriction endonuclease McrA